MQESRSHERAYMLAAMFVLAAACATRTPKTETPPPPSATITTESPGLPDPSSEALSQYAAGVSLETREGAAAAVPAYEKAFELDPQNSALAGKLAQIYIGRKERDKALALLEKAAKATPDSPEPWFWMGVTRRAGDERTEAIVAFLEALKLKHDHLPSLRAVVEVYFQKDETAIVPSLLERAFSQPSGDASFWLGLGDVYQFVLKQKKQLATEITPSRPVDCYEKARAITPRNPELLLRLAEAQMAAENFTGAAEVYTALLKLRPDLTQLRERLAQALLRADDKTKAIDALKVIVKREPLRYDVHNTIAELYQELDKDADAVVHLQQSLDINPNQFDVCVRLALVRLHQKRFTDALQTLDAARKKFPTRFQVPYLRGLVYSEQKDYPKAVAAYAEAEQLIQASEQDKPTSAFYFMYGAARERTGQHDKAATLFRKALELDPKNHNAANYLGYMWADRNENLNEALDLIKNAVAAQPDNAAYIDSLGWVYYRLGRHEEALTQLRRAVQLSAKEPDATVYEHLADVLHKLNRRDEAVKMLRKAAQLDPQNKELDGKLKQWTAK
ncbi:MAG: tetratricopeptide repeat protein [Verrucomicrobia bacterium]|nr:tetratricopeptide repeat protein [Verrucomicrobiota bacterium]